MTSFDRTPLGPETPTPNLAWLSAATFLVAIVGAIVLGLAGYPSLAKTVAAAGTAGAVSVPVTVKNRR